MGVGVGVGGRGRGRGVYMGKTTAGCVHFRMFSHYLSKSNGFLKLQHHEFLFAALSVCIFSQIRSFICCSCLSIVWVYFKQDK